MNMTRISLTRVSYHAIHPQTVAALTLICLLSGCATNTTDIAKDVIIDRRGVNVAQYEKDLADCSEYAAAVPVVKKTTHSAAGGAVVGGAIGAIIDRRRSVERGAGVGAVAGGARGYTLSKSEQSRVIKNCLRGRGYRVLN